MPGIESLLNSGMSGLNASQVGIQVTGQNIANVNTVGYSDQSVVLQDGLYANVGGLQIGSGVTVTDIQRAFSQFVEQSYNTAASTTARYNALYQAIQSVETTFNESSTQGASASLSQFFQDWQNLSLNPSSVPQRQDLLSDTQNLETILNQASSDLNTVQNQCNASISQDVSTLNSLTAKIAQINQQLDATDQPGVSNNNSLLDLRAQDIRQLAQIIDVNVIDNGSGNVTIMDKAGHTLVDGTNTFQVKLETNKVIPNLVGGSSFNGTIGFSGSDDFEYTVKVIQGGSVTSGAGAAQFEVSLDGGVTWLRSNSGGIETFSARPEGLSVAAGNLNIYFGQSSNSALAPTGQLSTGDTFTIVPKTGLFWYGSASTPVNITPQIAFNGQDNTTRVTGGSLAGEFQLRDYDIGRYKEQLNALTNSLIFETNRLHSQGAGDEMFTDVVGTYQARSPDLALGSNSSGLAFASRLSSGASMMYVYDSSTGQVVSDGFLNFNESGTGLTLFNPHLNTLSDVAGAINNSFGNFLTASVVNNQLEIDAKSGYTFGFGSDATGLWAALGVNTFFTGTDANTIATNAKCGSDPGFINAGQIDGTGVANSGDNSMALNIAGLATQAVSIRTTLNAPTSQSLSDYYNTLVGAVGTDTANAEFNYNFNNSLAQNLNSQQQSISGVNLDQEMTNLIKYQHSYQAAAKMISTADQMFQTVLGMKQ